MVVTPRIFDPERTNQYTRFPSNSKAYELSCYTDIIRVNYIRNTTIEEFSCLFSLNPKGFVLLDLLGNISMRERFVKSRDLQI